MADNRLTPDRHAPAVVQDRNAQEFEVGVRFANGTASLAGQPSDGDHITIDDGVNAPVRFEFDDDSSTTAATTNAPVVPVTIGASTAATMTAFILAVTQASTLKLSDVDQLYVRATANGATACTFKATVGGSALNQTITKSGANITVTGLTGGLDGGMANNLYKPYIETIAESTGYADNDYDIEGDLGVPATVFEIDSTDDIRICFNGETTKEKPIDAATSWSLGLNEMEISRVQIRHMQSGGGDATVRMFVTGRG